MENDYITPNEFEGSDVERIKQAVYAALEAEVTVLIPKLNKSSEGTREIWVLDSAILLPGNTNLVLDNCHLKLSDHCRDNFIRSANCGLDIEEIQPISNLHIKGIGNVLLEGADNPRSTGDAAKALGIRSYGTDAGNNNEHQNGDWRNIGILLAYVDNFSIENVNIKNSHCWAISLERCSNGIIRNLEFNSSGQMYINGQWETTLNQDGLDLRQGCHDILIENIKGNTGDDLIAFTNIVNQTVLCSGSLKSTMVSIPNCRDNGLDDIFNITIRNVQGYSKGGHHIIRFLNASGLKIYDITLDGLQDMSPPEAPCKATIKIGDSNSTWGGVTPLGDTGNFKISNVNGFSQHVILIAGSLVDSCIDSVFSNNDAYSLITLESGRENIKNVVFKNTETGNLKLET